MDTIGAAENSPPPLSKTDRNSVKRWNTENSTNLSTILAFEFQKKSYVQLNFSSKSAEHPETTTDDRLSN